MDKNTVAIVENHIHIWNDKNDSVLWRAQVQVKLFVKQE